MSSSKEDGYTIRQATEEGMYSHPFLERKNKLLPKTCLFPGSATSSNSQSPPTAPSPLPLALHTHSQPSHFNFSLVTDIPTILQLIHELASYEHALHEVLATEASLRSTLSFPSDPTKGYAKTLLITPTGSTGVAGMALYFHNYSTWRAAPGIYLEDLFMRPEFRGRGYGHALLRELARECVRLGCKRLEWSVLKWNEPSIKFYESEKVGAKMMSEWVGMRVDGEGLEKLAAGGD
jgi:GNAT superfamily N-acetyltransferase